MNHVSRPFMLYVDVDDLDSFKHEAVWKTLQWFDADRGRKFVNMLANKLRWLLLTNERTKFRTKRRHRKFAENGENILVEETDAAGYLDGRFVHAELMGQLSDSERSLIDMRLRDQMTFREIASVLRVSHATASKMYDRIIVRLKKFASRSEVLRGFHA